MPGVVGREHAERQLEGLAAELDRGWPDAASSLREGKGETLTLMGLGITGQLSKTLSSTNPVESMTEIVRRTQRNVTRWQDGDMCKRWTAAGMLQAEQQFRRIVGYSDLAKLVTAIERRHLTAGQPRLRAQCGLLPDLRTRERCAVSEARERRRR
jgi:hypothetical protein